MLKFFKKIFLLQLILSFTLLAENLKNQEPKYYIVEPNITLGEISIKLYGTTRMWKKIAQWNNLNPPYALKPNQKLVLKIPPKITNEKEANEKVLQMWRNLLAKKAGEKIPQELPIQKQQAETKQKFLEVYSAIEEQEKKELSKKELSAKDYFIEGENYFKKGQYHDALKAFQASRKLNDEDKLIWIYELRTLKALNLHHEAQEVAKKFIKVHPDASKLKFVQNILKSSQ